MLDLLHFVFLDFWHFVGTIILLGVVLDGTAKIVQAVRGSSVPASPAITPGEVHEPTTSKRIAP